MEKCNYYQVIEGSEMYYPWYVHKLEKENRALKKLLEWAEECGFGFDQFSDDTFNWDEFEEKTANMSYLESMIYYAERWLEENA